jgi:hypothetical protein
MLTFRLLDDNPAINRRPTHLFSPNVPGVHIIKWTANNMHFGFFLLAVGCSWQCSATPSSAGPSISDHSIREVVVFAKGRLLALFLRRGMTLDQAQRILGTTYIARLHWFYTDHLLSFIWRRNNVVTR